MTNRDDASTGTKHDAGKAPWYLLPFDAIGEVVRVLDFGAKKYAERNWEKGIAYSRVFAAAQRHLAAWWHGEDCDPETGLSHIAHASCCALFLLAFVARGRNDLDDRPGALADAPLSAMDPPAVRESSPPGYLSVTEDVLRAAALEVTRRKMADDPAWRSIGGVSYATEQDLADPAWRQRAPCSHAVKRDTGVGPQCIRCGAMLMLSR